MTNSVSTPGSVTVTVNFTPPNSAGTQANDTAPVSVSVALPVPADETVDAPTPPENPPTPPPAVPPTVTTTQPNPGNQAVANPAGAPVVKPAADTPEATPATTPAPSFWMKWKKGMIPALIILALVIIGLVIWQLLRSKGPGKGLVSGNGRLEATEIDVSSKLGGRVQDILVADGDFVSAGQTLAHMQVQTLEAQRDEASARHQQSITGVASAEAQVAMRESDKQAALALVTQRESEFDAAKLRLARSETLAREGASSEQELDDDRARMINARAAVGATKAQVKAAQSAIIAARTQVVGARSAVTAVGATVTRIKADITDSALISPRDGRVQYRIAQPGEVLAPGGKVLNLVDLGDVYMTFFVPEAAVGNLALGSEVHLVLDAAPQYVIPAKVSFVASTAQFTPKTVETASERQKLMFRVKAQIDPGLLQKHLKQVKTGLPGVAWIKLDSQAQWPSELAVKVPW